VVAGNSFSPIQGSLWGCGNLIFSYSGVFLVFWPGVIVSQEVAQRMGGEAIHELGTHLDQMFLGLETLFFPRAPAKGSS
jgi:hypothetical protein